MNAPNTIPSQQRLPVWHPPPANINRVEPSERRLAMQAKFKILPRQKKSPPAAPSCATCVAKLLAGAMRLGLAASIFTSFAIACAAAQEASSTSTAQGANSVTPAAQEPGFFTGLFAPSRTNLLGDIGGLRSAIGNYGLTFTLIDLNEGFGNPTGGIKQGANYNGLTVTSLSLDTQKGFGLAGGTVNISAFQIHGRDLSSTNLLDLQTYSGVAALPSTRLWEMWYQQTFLDGKMDVKLGQQSLDTEFIVSQGSSLFINTMMGWPMLPSADLYAGGPAYPLSALGARLRAKPLGPLTLLAGVFQDNPPGGPFNDDSQLRGSSAWGGNFLNAASTGALFITEAQYAVNQPSPGDMDDGKNAAGLPGTYKVGAWFDTAAFPNQRYATNGVSLANPASSGVAQMDDTNFSLYAVADQMIWRPNADSTQALGLFTRVMAAPDDRNLISFSVNSGATLKAPFQGRDGDTFGAGFGVARLSSFASGLAQDTAFYTGLPTPVPSIETFVELTYQCQVTPWWQLQPDFQYVFRPGGGIPNPNDPTIRVGDESIFGLRSTVTF
jgi:porin